MERQRMGLHALQAPAPAPGAFEHRPAPAHARGGDAAIRRMAKRGAGALLVEKHGHDAGAIAGALRERPPEARMRAIAELHRIDPALALAVARELVGPAKERPPGKRERPAKPARGGDRAARRAAILHAADQVRAAAAEAAAAGLADLAAHLDKFAELAREQAEKGKQAQQDADLDLILAIVSVILLIIAVTVAACTLGGGGALVIGVAGAVVATVIAVEQLAHAVLADLDLGGAAANLLQHLLDGPDFARFLEVGRAVAENVAGGVGDAAVSLVDASLTVVGEVVTDTTEGASDATHDAADAVQDAVSDGKDAAKDAADQAGDTGQQVANDASDAWHHAFG